MSKKFIFYILFFCSSVSLFSWTELHECHYSEGNVDQEELLYTKENVNHFEQLLVSWNAQRPKSGALYVHGRVRDKVSKKWDKWHKMYAWGQNIQKSFFSRGEASTFNYARLEMEKEGKADAFQLKITADNPKDLQHVKALFATTVDRKEFVPEKWTSAVHELDSSYVKGVPIYSQMILDHPKANVLCSPTSLSMLVGALKNRNIDPTKFAEKVYDQGLDTYGNWAFNMAHAYEQTKGKYLFAATRLASFRALHAQLEKGLPVVVSVRGNLPGAAKKYRYGHLLAVVGYNAQDKKVLCHDPAFESKGQVQKAYNLRDFLVAWEQSHRLTYKVQEVV